MHSYEGMRQKYGKKISRTIDHPVMILDYFELKDLFVALLIVLIFGVFLYSWVLMISLLLGYLIINPIVKRKFPRGIYLHFPYSHFGMTLPGLINPIKHKSFSD